MDGKTRGRHGLSTKLRHQCAAQIMSKQATKMTGTDRPRVHLDQVRVVALIQKEVKADEARTTKLFNEQAYGFFHAGMLNVAHEAARAGGLRVNTIGDETRTCTHE